jgi:putative ABC transport system permease protein
MKYVSFILKNILRNKRRTFLVFISLSFALFLFVFLFTVLSSMNKIMYRPSIMNNIFLSSKSYDGKWSDLPESYISKIKKLPHVLDASPCLQIFTYFDKPTKVINVWGIIPEKLNEIMDINKIEGLGLSDLSKEKASALVGNYLMEEYNWKIGDIITLKSGITDKEIQFTIKGIVHGVSNASYIIYLNLGYLQEVINNQGRLTFIYIKAGDPSFIPTISREAENLFRNFPIEITTFTQKSFMDSIVEKIQAILIAFRLIGLIAIISTFFLVANCITISIREKTSELGVMKVLGFSRLKILIIVLTESVGVALFGGAFGSILAYLLPLIFHITIPATIPLHVDSDFSLVVYGLCISMLIGFFGSVFPAVQSVLMKPSDALRNIG